MPRTAEALLLADWFPWPDDMPRGNCYASCEPHVFDGETAADVTRARSVCAGCPAAAWCLTMGVQWRATGVWGGVLLDAGNPATDERARIAA